MIVRSYLKSYDDYYIYEIDKYDNRNMVKNPTVKYPYKTKHGTLTKIDTNCDFHTIEERDLEYGNFNDMNECVSFKLLYNCQNPINDTVTINDVNVLHFDIEFFTYDGVKPDPNQKTHCVCMIGYRIVRGNKTIGSKYNILTLDKDTDINNDKCYRQEKDILIKFINVIAENNIHIVHGFNVIDTDMSFIYARCIFYGIGDYFISKVFKFTKPYFIGILKKTVDYYFTYGKTNTDRNIEVGGVIFFDSMFSVFLDTSIKKVPNRKLKTILRYFGHDVLSFDSNVMSDTYTLFQNRYDEFYRYMRSDIDATNFICDKYLDTYFFYNEYLNIPISESITKTKSRMGNYLILKMMLSDNYYPYELNHNINKNQLLSSISKKTFQSTGGANYQGALVGIAYDKEDNKIDTNKSILDYSIDELPINTEIDNRCKSDRTILNKSFDCYSKIDFKSLYPFCAVSFNIGYNTTYFNYTGFSKTTPHDILNPSSKKAKDFKRIIPNGYMFKNGNTYIDGMKISQSQIEEFKHYFKKNNSEEEYNYIFRYNFKHCRNKNFVRSTEITFPDFVLNRVVSVIISREIKSTHTIKIEELREIRDQHKRSGNDLKQNETKILMNSAMYGQAGNKFGYLDISYAVTITGMCRFVSFSVIHIIEHIYGKGSVVYLDTDGFVLAVSLTDKELEHLNLLLKQYIHKITTFDNTRFILENEKSEVNSKIVMFQSKTYAVIDNKNDKNLTGSSLSNIKQNKISKLIINDIIDGKSQFYLYDKYITNIKKFKKPDFAISIKIRKNIKDYRNNIINTLVGDNSRGYKKNDVIVYYMSKCGYRIYDKDDNGIVDFIHYIKHFKKTIDGKMIT